MPDALQPLRSEADLDAALAHSALEPVVLFKHSSACPLSAYAYAEMRALAAEPGGPPVYRLVVQAQRALSNALAQRFGVRHESPQVLVVHHQQLTFHASHGRVRAAAVRAAAADALAASQG